VLETNREKEIGQRKSNYYRILGDGAFKKITTEKGPWIEKGLKLTRGGGEAGRLTSPLKGRTTLP